MSVIDVASTHKRRIEMAFWNAYQGAEEKQ